MHRKYHEAGIIKQVHQNGLANHLPITCQFGRSDMVQLGSMRCLSLLRRPSAAALRPASFTQRLGFSSTAFDEPQVRVCVVGSGPAGFYAAKYLLKDAARARVDMLEALPTPFGLVRAGVAPDHPEVKSVMHDFEKVAADARFRFLGNVRVGEDVRLAELQRHYHAVVLAYGAAGDRELGVPGEHLAGVLSARAFVNWYNGHPDFRDLHVDLSGDTAVIFGQGNVAVDCARILTKSVDELATTDISQHAVDALRSRCVCDLSMASAAAVDVTDTPEPSLVVTLC